MLSKGNSLPDGRILITGGAGFIGTHLARRFEREGRSVVVIDNLIAQPMMPTCGQLLCKSVEEMSAGDLEGVACVYHLAAHKSVPLSFDEAPSYLANIAAATRLLELARETRLPRLIIASTCEVYGNSVLQPIPESQNPDPRSPYAVTKCAVDHMARVFRRAHDLDITSVRLFNVYGPGERPDAVVPSFCRKLMLGEPIEIEGDGEQRRDFTHVTDIVEALFRLAGLESCPFLVNLGSGSSVSINALAGDLVAIHGSGTSCHRSGRPEEIDTFVADTSLARELIGFEPVVPWQDGLKDIYRWWNG